MGRLIKNENTEVLYGSIFYRQMAVFKNGTDILYNI